MHSAIPTDRTHQGMMIIWVVKMAGQGLECGKIMEICAFFLGKVPLRTFLMIFKRNTCVKLPVQEALELHS